jgi:UDP-GlcNAc:undecaprenyl-phosphate GlcNAc-1-phosphate transferase
VAIGLSERRAVLLLWVLAAVGGSLGIAIAQQEIFNKGWSVLAALAFLAGMVWFAAYLAGIRVYDDTDTRVKQGTFTPIVVEFMYKRRVAEVLLDFFLIVLCYYAAYRLRFEDPVSFMANFMMFRNSLPIIFAAQLVAFFAVGVYRGAWRHFGMMDTLVVAKGVFLGAITAHIAIFLVQELYGFFAYSRAVFIIYGVFLLVAVTLSRASFRLVGEFIQRQRRSGRRVVIYGAGDAAGLVLREVLAGEGGDVRILGFIDDDPRKAGVRAMGYAVLGGFSALTVLIKAASVDCIVISARHMPPERLNNLEVLCADFNVSLSRLRVGLESIVEIDAEPDANSQSRATRLR